MYCAVISTIGMFVMSTSLTRTRWSSRSSGPSNCRAGPARAYASVGPPDVRHRPSPMACAHARAASSRRGLRARVGSVGRGSPRSRPDPRRAPRAARRSARDVAREALLQRRLAVAAADARGPAAGVRPTRPSPAVEKTLWVANTGQTSGLPGMWRCVRCGSVSIASTFLPRLAAGRRRGRSRCHRTSTSCGRRFPGAGAPWSGAPAAPGRPRRRGG